MTHVEIEELLGAYALDAVDDDERRAVEEHLATCPRCRAEVAAHREVAALLGNGSGESPSVAPENLWDRIAASLQEEPPVLASVVRPPSWRRFALILPIGAVAAALVLIVGLLAAKVGNLDQRVQSLSHQTTIASAISDPAHRTVVLTSASKATWQATAVVLPNGEGYVISSSIPAIGSSRTFQLWALARGKIVSLGVLGSDPVGAAIRVEPTMTLLMITAEPVGGTPAPTTPVLVRGELPVRL